MKKAICWSIWMRRAWRALMAVPSRCKHWPFVPLVSSDDFTVVFIRYGWPVGTLLFSTPLVPGSCPYILLSILSIVLFFSAGLNVFNLFLIVCVDITCVCSCMHWPLVLMEAKDIRSSELAGGCELWVLDAKCGTSGRAVCTPNYGAISPAPSF